MTFGFYIRNTLEISQFILISSVYEIYLFKTTESMRCISLAFASLLLLCYILILFIVNYFILFKTEPEESMFKKLNEFFSCLKENRKPRFYITILLLRRLLFVTLLIVLESIQSKQILGILMFVQLLYLIFIVTIRPYKQIKENFIEILNEHYFSLFLIVLIFLNTQNEWSFIRTTIFMWILVSNSLIVFLTIFTYSILISLRYLKEKWKKPSEAQENTTKVTPLPSIISGTSMYNYKATHERKSNKAILTVSTNKQREESKYEVQDNISEIRIIPRKNWS